MSASEAATRTSARRTLRVLYIEDSPHDAKLCLRQLEQAGYELSARLVTSREEFEEDLRTQPYDVILADYRTPTWSAMEALEALKQVDKDLPFIIVTGTLGDEGAVECIKRGATDYVLKDRPARLPQAVERALEEKAAREEHQRVEASRKLLASIVESSEDAIVSRAREGNVLSWNRGAEKMFGYSAEEAIGRPISMLVPPECARELGQIQERVAQGESVGRYETVRMAKDGRRIDVSLVVSPIFDAAGRITGASSIHRDITERKRAEEALARRAKELERSNTELEQFAFVASHDLQEPLRMVASYTQLLAERYQGKLDADADEFIAFAVEGAQRMQKLIHDLLTYSRLGTRREEFKPTECGQALGRALQNLAASIEESRASVTHDPLPTVMADGSQLTQLFQNLVSNAIKFGDQQPPRVHISAERNDAEWTFSVQDHGIGIDAQYADRIFVIFQRLHPRNEYPGTGIGLAISKKIVERHRGRIWFESKLGEGATFKFTIPADGVTTWQEH
ncbi:MAG: hypothetical protein DMG25_08425 [Acidobacteria bacterium]|nr:MAG: hypothetical protein DMG25_08425 [Acidobacteriota bacterium]